MRSQMDHLQQQQQYITVLHQVAMQPQNQPRPVSVPPAASENIDSELQSDF